MVNIRVKGASAERDIANDLNAIILKVLTKLGVSDTDNHNYFVQRNQNQTAVGGNDLINTYGFGIEVKRQEQLSINTWWQQCTAAALKNNETPVLLYRQTRQKWQCYIQGYVLLPGGGFGSCRSKIEYDMFLKVFEMYVEHKLRG